ncbi:beta-N-acetylhexosaminidase [Cognatitamlana onchidii]|uniref:beta-N-acetylhexosaminidase n=1 Tax=Cognatitamlana onchidii TaxID=2562860 RepID=UPI0010A60E78|nr:family 20 glycosylhydrolase [Algibacter onchidii]
MKKNILAISFFTLCLKLCIAQSILTESYNLMPWPQDISENTAKFIINSDVTISLSSDDSDRVRNAAVIFLRRLSNRTGVFLNEGFPLKERKGNIQIIYKTHAPLNIKTDESYTLTVNDSLVQINANTDIGALRGLQTLLQLITNSETEYYFPGVNITDSPRFVWRGLMIDVSRHFHPVHVIKRNLDAMASVKMNVFHWHLTDDQGFRIESKVYPKLQSKASDGLFYTQEQIKEVVAYANLLGIRVIPEIDVPGHASAILSAYPELGSLPDYNYSIERFAGVFHPTLDPTNELTYEFLENLFTEITPLFPDDYFHIGGDENEGKHWTENKAIEQFKTEHNLKTNHDLQTYFNIRLEKTLNKLGKKLMGWDEIMTPGMPTSAVIHSWRGENEGLPNGGSLIKAAKSGYQTVLSNGFYIDRMLSVDHHYSIEPIGDIALTPEERERVLGGEATMWSELVTPLTIDSRIWPRTAAIAERFWSAKEIRDLEHMQKRLAVISYQLEEQGITHIKNRAVILRSMTNNQDISALQELSNICEPLKVYSRNKDGIEYKTFSPFNLFADACIVDAKDALSFNKAVIAFQKEDTKSAQQAVLHFLKQWQVNYSNFSKLTLNPKISALEPLSKHLSKTSGLLLKCFEAQKVSTHDLDDLNTSLEVLKQEFMDTEVVIVAPLEILITYCKTNFQTR